MKKLIFALVAISFLTSCEEETTQKQPIEVNHDNSIMVSINQDNREKFTILTSIDSIYKNGNYLGRIVHIDTIPTLGETTDTFDTEEVIQDSEGNEVYKTEQVTHQKAYQLYINVAKK
jgi:hypothetical protein